MLLEKLLHRMLGEGEVVGEDVLVWDTSSLSHAFEEFSHAAVSAYMEMRPPKVWEALKRRLERRLGSESRSRRLLLRCDTTRCMAPRSVYHELSQDPHYQDSLDMLTGGAWRVEAKYVRRRSGRGDPTGFSRTFMLRLLLSQPRRELVDYVLATAERLGLRISRADAEGIALAIENNAVLVTGDRRQAEVADKLGAKVYYTI